MVRTRRQGLACALCWLMLNNDFIVCAHLRVRHAYGNIGRKARFSDSSSVLQQMSSAERLAFEENIRHSKPIAHLKRRYMKRLKKMDVDEVVDQLGQKLPPEIAALAKSTKHHQKADKEFSEKSIAKARKILNGMVEEAQGRLDVKRIGCKVFYDRNRGAWGQAQADLSRIAEQITDLTRMIDESTIGIQNSIASIQTVEEKRTMAIQAYNKVRTADEVELSGRMDDLAVAKFILEFTVCKDKQWKKKVLFQSNFNVLRCESQGGDLEFHFEDPKLEAQANKFLTPGARAKLQKYLGDAHSKAAEEKVLLQTGSDFRYPSQASAERDEDDEDDEDDEGADDNDESAVQTSVANKDHEGDDDDDDESKSVVQTTKQDPTVTLNAKDSADREESEEEDDHDDDNTDDESDATKDVQDVTVNARKVDASHAMEPAHDTRKSKDALLSKRVQATVAEGVEIGIRAQTAAPPNAMDVKVIAGASDKQARKCTLGKPNCGLLHDNMSLMWGDFKDAVDQKKAEMDRKKQDHEDLLKDLNEELTTFVLAKSQFSEKLSEANGQKLVAVQEQDDKNKARLLLEQEFAERWGECQAEIYEIMYTDICGVLTVRGEISLQSKKVPPNEIVDCDFGEFEPAPCSLTCDDTCNPHGGTAKCGGVQVLTREIIIQPNEFGHKCPKLEYTRECGQIKCPVNCQMSRWSGWSQCTKECEVGNQLRDRHIVTKPLNGGEGCDLPSESRTCNTGSCDRDCTLKPWTKWTPCSQACDAGFREKFRHILVPVRGLGKCPEAKNTLRFQSEACNTHPCVGDEMCIATMDLIIAIDGSGSLREEGYGVLRDFAAALARRMKGEAYGYEAVKLGVVQFGNGKIDPGGTITPGKQICDLGEDPEDVAKKIEGTVWEKGFTNMAQAFVTAEKMFMNGGRDGAPSTMLIISDGKPTFKFETMNVVKEARSKGVRVVVVTVNDKLGKEDRKFMQAVASHPWRTNYVKIPGMKKLKAEMDKYVTQTLVQSCPRAESPSSSKIVAENQGFELFKDGLWCGKGPTFHHMIGQYPDVSDCFREAQDLEATYFFHGTGDGNKNFCYIEMAEDPEKCPEGFVEAEGQLFHISEEEM